MPTRPLVVLVLALAAGACSSNPPSDKPEQDVKETRSYPTLGKIERLDPALDQLIAGDAQIERLAEGYEWAEGPVWVGRGGGHVLFSDVIKNVVHKWDPKTGAAAPFLSPSGYTGQTPRGGEPGSDRKSVALGKSVDLGGRRIIKKKTVCRY